MKIDSTIEIMEENIMVKNIREDHKLKPNNSITSSTTHTIDQIIDHIIQTQDKK